MTDWHESVGWLLHATLFAVVAWFVFFTAMKAQGPRLQMAGKVLAGWLALLAAVSLIAALAAPMMHGRPLFGPHMQTNTTITTGTATTPDGGGDKAPAPSQGDGGGEGGKP